MASQPHPYWGGGADAVSPAEKGLAKQKALTANLKKRRFFCGENYDFRKRCKFGNTGW